LTITDIATVAPYRDAQTRRKSHEMQPTNRPPQLVLAFGGNAPPAAIDAFD
jgi:hypothetical protein